MNRRIPLLPTAVVLAAVLVMIALGAWQLFWRAPAKDAALARFEAAAGLPPVAWPDRPIAERELPLFRRSTGLCLQPVAASVTAGRNRQGESGYRHLVDCRTGAEGPGMRVDIGWSRNPTAGARWSGGPVSGVIAPDRQRGLRLVSDRGFGGLQPSAPPSPAEIPNNHRSYAVQWFLFAASALLIYGLALRARNDKANA